MSSWYKIAAIALLLPLGTNACGNSRRQTTPAGAVKRDTNTPAPIGTGSAKAMPNLTVREGTQLDIGTVLEGTEPHVSFTLTNNGTAEATIVIDDLSQGGCSAVSLIPKIPAGSSRTLEFVFETLGHGGRSETRTIRINYNNPVLSPLEISASAKILPVEKYQAAIGELWYGFYILVDVRSPKEFAKEHAVGSLNVPMPELDRWASHLPRHLLFYLISEDGRLSDQAALMLRKRGFSQCVSLVGGLSEWRKREGKKELLIATSR